MILRSIGIGLFWLLALVAGLWLAQVAAPQPVILVVPIYGDIDGNMADFADEKLSEAVADPAVASIVLAVDSGGGDAVAGERIHLAILQARKTKPVFVSVRSSAMSAAYFLAVAAEAIYAPATARVGNVGAVSRYPDDSAYPNWAIFTGPYKFDDPRFDRIRQLDLSKDSFVSTVVHHRQQAHNPLKLNVAEMMEGRNYQGREALALGLIDAIGGRGDAVAASVALTGIRNYKVVEAELPPIWALDHNRFFLWDGQNEAPALPTPAGEE